MVRPRAVWRPTRTWPTGSPSCAPSATSSELGPVGAVEMSHSLIVFRHSKSDWSADYGGPDLERPLAKRGRKAARAAGRFLAATEVPDSVICSPAPRATATLALASEARDWVFSVRESDALYAEGVEEIGRAH